jgi:WD40 repeat protein
MSSPKSPSQQHPRAARFVKLLLLAVGIYFTWPYISQFLRWSFPTRVTFGGHRDVVSAVAFSPDGSILATGSLDGTAVLWESSSGRQIAVSNCHSGAVLAIAYSPDGKYVATTSTDSTVAVLDGRTGVLLGRETHGARTPGSAFREVYSVGFTPDSNTLLTGGADGALRLWNPMPLRQRGHITGDKWMDVFSFGFIPGALDQVAIWHRYGTLRRYDIAKKTDEKLVEAPNLSSGCTSAVAPDGKIIAYIDGFDRRVMYYNLQSSQTRAAFEITERDGIRHLTFSPDGTLLISLTRRGNVAIWDTASDDRLYSVTRHWVTSVAFDPDGKRIACGMRDGSTSIWDISKAYSRRRIGER